METKEAKATANDLPLSWKGVVMIGNFIRGKTVQKSKRLLQEVMEERTAVPFTRFNKDRGHKKGEIAAGRYPVRAANEILNLLESAESNAVNMGMNANDLVVSRFIGNKGSTSWRFGRKRRRQAKRAHVEIYVSELKQEKKKEKKSVEKKGVAKK